MSRRQGSISGKHWWHLFWKISFWSKPCIWTHPSCPGTFLEKLTWVKINITENFWYWRRYRSDGTRKRKKLWVFTTEYIVLGHIKHCMKEFETFFHYLLIILGEQMILNLI